MTMLITFLSGDWSQLVRLKPVLHSLSPIQTLKVKPLLRSPEWEDLLYSAYLEISFRDVGRPAPGVRGGEKPGVAGDPISEELGLQTTDPQQLPEAYPNAGGAYGTTSPHHLQALRLPILSRDLRLLQKGRTHQENHRGERSEGLA